MLEKGHETSDGPSAEALERYLEDTLLDRVRVSPLHNVSNLPSFIGRTYRICVGRIAGRRCVFLVATDHSATPSDIAKQPWLGSLRCRRHCRLRRPGTEPTQPCAPDSTSRTFRRAGQPALYPRPRHRLARTLPSSQAATRRHPVTGGPGGPVPSPLTTRRNRDHALPHSQPAALFGDVDRTSVR